jgi:hypothetical protein
MSGLYAVVCRGCSYYLREMYIRLALAEISRAVSTDYRRVPGIWLLGVEAVSMWYVLTHLTSNRRGRLNILVQCGNVT